MEMSILWVVMAGFLEPVWVVSMKRYTETKNLLYAGVVLFFMIFGPMCLSFAEAGGVAPSMAFAVWVSIGTVMTTLAGFKIYNDPMGRARVLCILMIMVGVVGLQFPEVF